MGEVRPTLEALFDLGMRYHPIDWSLISATRFGTICNPDIMAEHYDENKSGLHDLIDYTSQSLDKGAQMQLEFKHGKISMFHVIGENDSIWSYNWDIHSEDRIDSLMQVVGLNHENSRKSNES